MVTMANKMEWSQAVVIHGTDYYNSQILQTLISYMPEDGSTFLKDVQPFAATYDVANNDISDNSQALDAILTAGLSDLPVFVLMHPYGIHPFVESLKQRLNSSQFSLNESLHPKQKLKILFSNLVTGDELDYLSNDIDVYSVVVDPIRIPHFEQYWIDRVRLLKVCEACHFLLPPTS